MSVRSYQRMENAGCLEDFQRLEEINAALLDAAKKALRECVDLVGTDAGDALEHAISRATGAT